MQAIKNKAIQLSSFSSEQLQDYLNLALERAGHPQLMSSERTRTLAAHAANSLRVLNQMASDLFNSAAERNMPRIDESLFPSFILFKIPAHTLKKPLDYITKPCNFALVTK